MAEKFVHFIAEGTDLMLPVTPSSYTWGAGQNIESVNINEVGDVNLPGNPTRYSGRFESFFPANAYPWMAPGSSTDPWIYVQTLIRWATTRMVARLIIEGTDVNTQVLLGEITYGEQDGSGDIYVTISAREWVELEAVTVSEAPVAGMGGTQNGSQPSDGPEQAQTYTIVAGDMLSVICRRFYGNGTATYYNALAKYNGIKNPHLIYPGTVLTIPPESELMG